MNKSNLRHIDLVVGLGHGDEGKGMTAMSLAYLRTIGKCTIIACKGNGSGQASHKVMFDNNSGAGDDKQSFIHKYSSGATFAPIAVSDVPHTINTILTPDVVIDLPTLYNEVVDIHCALSRMELSNEDVSRPYILVHENSLVTTPLDIAFNHLKEKMLSGSRQGKHGSCGIGFNETLRRSEEMYPIYMRDILDNNYKSCANMMDMYNYYQSKAIDLATSIGFTDDAVREQFNEFISQATYQIESLSHAFDYYCRLIRGCVKLNTFNLSVYTDFAKEISYYSHLIIESNQGVLIGDEFGVMPHATPSDTTGKKTLLYVLNSLEKSGADLSQIDFTYQGITRTFSTRHGNGPFVHLKPLQLSFIQQNKAIHGEEEQYMVNRAQILREEHNCTNEHQGSLRYSLLSLDNLSYIYADFNNYMISSGLKSKLGKVDYKVNVSHIDAVYFNGDYFEYIHHEKSNFLNIRGKRLEEVLMMVSNEIAKGISGDINGVIVSTLFKACGPQLMSWVGPCPDF